MPKLTSRDRMLRTISLQPVDYIPCCFMSFTALRQRCQENLYALVKAERHMGLDSMLFIPSAPRSHRAEHPDLRGLPVRFHPDVKVREWQAGGVLHKEYLTPAGSLTTSVRLSDDWPHGDHIPFVDDFQVPRALKPLITQPAELNSLQFLLQPPSQADRLQFRQEIPRARAFAAEEGVLLVGGWGVGMDMANWLCGMQDLMFLVMDQPDMVISLLEMIHRWNMRRMELVLSAPVDLYIRRAWYEGCDFITPSFYRTAVLPRLKAEADLAHTHGAKFGYICSSGTRPILDYFLEAGIDVLVGIDPIQGSHTDLPLIKEKLGGRVCLWGGISGAVTVELGTESHVRAAVQHAIETLGPTGLVLSPVDNITVDAPQTWANIDVLIDEWQKQRVR